MRVSLAMFVVKGKWLYRRRGVQVCSDGFPRYISRAADGTGARYPWPGCAPAPE